MGAHLWIFGILMLGRPLFRRSAPDEETADKNQLAQMVALLTPSPEALLADLGPRALEFFLMRMGLPKGLFRMRRSSRSLRFLWNMVN